MQITKVSKSIFFALSMLSTFIDRLRNNILLLHETFRFSSLAVQSVINFNLGLGSSIFISNIIHSIRVWSR